MSVRTKLLLAGLIAAIGLGAVGVALSRTGGVRDYLDQTFTRVSQDGNSAVYTAPRVPSDVAGQISSRHPPADTLVQPSGYFLRYRDDIVVVTADGPGSRIYLDDEQRGYAHWFPVIGGLWGTYRGGGETFRGGGPGAGK